MLKIERRIIHATDEEVLVVVAHIVNVYRKMNAALPLIKLKQELKCTEADIAAVIQRLGHFLVAELGSTGKIFVRLNARAPEHIERLQKEIDAIAAKLKAAGSQAIP